MQLVVSIEWHYGILLCPGANNLPLGKERQIGQYYLIAISQTHAYSRHKFPQPARLYSSQFICLLSALCPFELIGMLLASFKLLISVPVYFFQRENKYSRKCHYVLLSCLFLKQLKLKYRYVSYFLWQMVLYHCQQGYVFSQFFSLWFDYFSLRTWCVDVN